MLSGLSSPNRILAGRRRVSCLLFVVVVRRDGQRSERDEPRTAESTRQTRGASSSSAQPTVSRGIHGNKCYIHM
jgi:hypothetical protein